jgi:DNA-binding protein HU-beta
MTKAEIVSEISHQTGIDKTIISKTAETLMETTKDSMVNDKNVYLR